MSIQVLESVAVPAHQVLASAKKRGRPSKKPSSVLDDSTIKDEPELPNIASKLDNTKTKRVKISEDQEDEEDDSFTRIPARVSGVIDGYIQLSTLAEMELRK